MEPAAATADADHPSSPTPPKRSPWNHPSSTNGSSHDALIDASSWPALADAANTAKTKYVPPPPPPLSDPKPPADSNPAPASSAAANSSNSPKHSSGSHHARHKPARRGGTSGSGNGNGGGDHSPRDHPDRTNASWGDHGSSAGPGAGRGAAQRNHSNGGGRRGGGGGGGGGFGGRRRGGYDGGFYRGPPMGMGPYMRGAPPPPPPSYMGPPPPPVVSPMRPFPGPMIFHDMQSPISPVSPMYYVGPPPPAEALRGFAFGPPMVGPPPYPYPLPSPEPDAEAEAKERRAKLLTQIEFYFSKDNLCTDVYLRRNMDDQGWVNIALIATFKKVKGTTDDLEYIKETIQSSSILEIQDGKIRRKDDWNKWVFPRESNPDMPSSSAVATSSNINNLSAHLGGVSLHESAASSSGTADENHHEALLNGSTSNNGKAPVVEDNAGHH